MIDRIYIDNYKTLVNFEVKLQHISLLIGPNGVGKTSVLDVIFALRQLLSGVAKIADRDAFPSSSLTRWDSRQHQTLEVDVTLKKQHYRYRMMVEHEHSTGRARLQNERLDMEGKPLFNFANGEVQLYRDNHSLGPTFSADRTESALARIPARNDNVNLTRFVEFMRKIIVCALYPANFRPESTSEDEILLRDASNFAGWYRHLILERQELITTFTETIRNVIPGFRYIRMEKIGLDTRAFMIAFETQSHKYELRLDELSDGQRAIIALYSLIQLAAGQGYTLFLDEPDNYISLPEIQPWLMALADSFGENGVPQACICSHHPELIDYLGAESGLLLARDDSGITRVASVSDTPIENTMKLSEQIARGW